MPTRASASDLLALRLAAQLIDVPGAQDGSVVAAVRRLLALQAQDFAQSLWAVGLRTPGAVRSDVLAALADASVVRSLPMRGTLHLVAAEDLQWMLSVTSQRTLQSVATRFAGLGLDAGTFARAASVVTEALVGGNSLTRAEFMSLLELKGIEASGQRGYHIIFYLCQLGLVCWGPPRGTQQALVLVEEWIRFPRLLEREEALREFAIRYFVGHGPATERDFAWWTKLTLKDARAGIAAAGTALEQLLVDETVMFIAAEAGASAAAEDTSRASPASSAAIHLLPGFDEYLLGYQDRSLPLAAEHFERIVPGSNGIFLPIIVAKGRVIGTWRRGAQSAATLPDYFAPVSVATAKGFARAETRYAGFMAG